MKRSISLDLVDKPSDDLFAILNIPLIKIGLVSRNTKLIGKLLLEEGQVFVQLESENHTLGNFTDLKIEYNGYEGEIYLALSPTNYKICKGDGNVIKYQYRNRRYRFYVLLRNRKEKQNFKEVIRCCYERGINVEEYYRGKRTYLWEQLSYAEIQEFKRKFDLHREI